MAASPRATGHAAQLIQALYNIANSLFVGKYSQSGLTALSIIYPIQLLMTAFGVGTGVGINTAASGKLGVGDKKAADQCSGLCLPLELLLWVIFAAGCYFMMPWFAGISTSSKEVVDDVVSYGRIVCVFSFGLFLESGWTKVLQANGDCKRCRMTLNDSIIFGLVLMAVGAICFLSIPGLMLRAFSSDEEVIRIGTIGFRFIGVGFLPMVTSLIFPVFSKP